MFLRVVFGFVIVSALGCEGNILGFGLAPDGGTPAAGDPVGLPAPWQTADIGAVAKAGSASGTGASFSLVGPTGSGSSDPLRYVFLPISGDGQITAQVVSQTGQTAALAGVMLRESLDPGARYALAAFSPGTGAEFQRWSSMIPANAVQLTPSASAGAPSFVRIVRTGNAITSFSSLDGSYWRAMGADSISMAPSILMGLLVSSHDQVTEAGFAQVSVQGGAALPPSRVLHVDIGDPDANDGNDGSPDHPWRTLQQAASALVPGDTVMIHPGTYFGDVFPQNSGTADAPIRYAAMPGAILQGASFQILGKSYLTLDGLQVQDVAAGDGIDILGPGVHLSVVNTFVSHTFGSCIAAWGVGANQDPTDPILCPNGSFKCLQYIAIDNNTVERCNDGGTNENIDVAQGVDQFEVRGNVLRNGGAGIVGGEGIDIKEGVSNGWVAENTVNFIARDPGIYFDGGGFWPDANPRPRSHDIVISGNRLTGVGIRLDAEHSGDIDHVLIVNNVVTQAPHDGIIVYYYSGSVGLMDSISIINNTAYGNSTADPFWNGISLAHPTATNVVIRNNIAWDNPGGQIYTGQSVNDHNLTGDPQFVDAASGNFHLGPISAALNAGAPGDGVPQVDIDGLQRSVTAPTVGAFEH